MRKAVDNHCFAMRGIRKACTVTRELTPGAAHGGRNVQISYDTEQGRVIAAICEPGVYMHYDSPCVIWVATVFAPLTMQAIADKVAQAIKLRYSM